MELKKLMQWRYAVKKFDENKKINDEKLQKILEITNLTPTSYGLQPYKIIVVKNQKIKEKLVAASYGQTKTTNTKN